MDLIGRLTDSICYGALMVCIQKRLTKIAALKINNIDSVKTARNTLVSEFGPPEAICADQKSLIKHI